MKTLYFEKFNWDGKKITITINDRIKEKIQEDDMKLFLRFRNNKNLLQLNYDIEEGIDNNIIIDISKIRSSIYEIGVWDLVVSFSENKYLKLVKLGEVNKKILRFYEPIYRVNDREAIIPYLTTNNEVSLYFDIIPEVLQRYCDVKDIYLDIDNIKINKNIICYRIKNLNISNSEEIHIFYKNNTNSLVLPNYNIEIEDEIINVRIDLDDYENLEIGKEYELIILLKKGKSVQRVNFLCLGEKYKNITNIGDIENSVERYFIPTISEENIIQLYIANYELALRKKYNFMENDFEINEYAIIDNILKLNIDLAKLNEKISLQEDVYKKCEIILNDNSVTYYFETCINDNGEIYINIHNILENIMVEKTIELNINLRFYFDSDIFEFKLKQGKLNKEIIVSKFEVDGQFINQYISKDNLLTLFISSDKELYNERNLCKVYNYINIENIKIVGNNLYFDIDENAYLNRKDLIIYAENDKLNEKYIFEGIKINKNSISIDMSNFIEFYSSNKGLWKLSLEQRDNTYIQIYSFVKYKGKYLTKYNKYFNAFEDQNINNVYTYLNDNNELGLIVDTEDYINQHKIPQKVKKSKLNIENLSVNDGIFKAKVNLNYYNEVISKCVFYLEERKTKERYYFEKITYTENGIMEFSIKDFINKYVDFPSRWNLYSEIVYDSFIEVSRVRCCDNNEKIKYKKYLNNINYSVEDKNIIAPYLTNTDEISFVVRDKRFYYNEKYELKTKIDKFKMKKNYINFEVVFDHPESTECIIENVTMKLRSKVDDIEYNLNFDEHNLNLGQKVINFNIDLTKYELKQFYWEFYLILNINNEKVYKRIENAKEEVINNINESVIKNNYINNEKCIVYPYITPKGVLFLAYRQMDEREGKRDRINELLGYKIYSLLKKYYDKKDIWLVYEKMSETAQDNSYYFFKYVYENHHDKNIYYVMKKDSPDYVNLKGMEDRVLNFMSIKHIIYMCAAKLLVASETRGHCYLWRHQKGKVKDILNKKKFVFLQHGVTAFKINDSVLSRKSESAVSLYVVTSNFERDVIKNGLGYSEDEIIVTGFTRWDHLKNKSDKINPKQIFLMPTWRGWLDEIPEEEFVQTEYYKNYTKVLNSERLQKILKDNNLILNFYIHPKFKQYVDSFNTSSEYIKIIGFGEQKVNELLMTSSLLITDYSSVAWEFYYLKKPVIFYQFDIDDYNRLTGSYVDMEKELFGDRVFNCEDLVNTIDEYVNNSFKEKEKFINTRDKYFKYIDNNNSKRVYDEILKSKVLWGNSSKKVAVSKKYKKLRKNKIVKLVWNLSKKNKYMKKIASKIKNNFKKIL